MVVWAVAGGSGWGNGLESGSALQIQPTDMLMGWGGGPGRKE